MTRIRRNAWMLAAASGVLQVLIFPEPALYVLSWVALAPLIYAILQCRNQDALLTMVEDGKWYCAGHGVAGLSGLDISAE